MRQLPETNPAAKIRCTIISILSVFALGAAMVAGLPEKSIALLPSEREALIDFYLSTGGPSWTRSSNWLGPIGTECQWEGVVCDETQSTVVDIELRRNNLIGTLPESLDSLTNLWCMNLGENSLTGEIPATYSSFERLHCLLLDNNKIEGRMPDDLAKLTELRSLNLENNLLTGEVPRELGELKNITGLWLSGNRLAGSVPYELGSMEKLEVLALSSNNLGGPLPVSLGSLASLRELWLENNSFTGPIPETLGNLSSLEELWLSNNNFSGTIPSSLVSLSKLRELWLENNMLEGGISASIANLSNLEKLSVARNKMQGALPMELALLSPNLSADLRFNAFRAETDELDLFIRKIEHNDDWTANQTSAPKNLSIKAWTTDSLELSWEPTGLLGFEGGYEIYGATDPGGPWVLAKTVWNKEETGTKLSGLPKTRNYFIKVVSFTNPNTNNKNRVVSEPTPVLEARGSERVSGGGGNGSSGGCFLKTLLGKDEAR